MPDTHDLPNDVKALKRLLLEHRSRLRAQHLEIEHLKVQLSRLRRWKFGRSSEQMELQIAQIELTLEALQAVSAQPADLPQEAPAAVAKSSPGGKARRPRRHPVRRALPAHLPRETIVHLSPAVKNGCTCGECGGKVRKLDQDVAEMLEYVPGYFKVIRHVREKHSCVRCSSIFQASAPSRPIQRGLPGPGLLAHITAGKYCYQQPLYRQSEVYGYAGVPINRSTLTHWVGSGCELLSPIVAAIRRHVFGGHQLHADDTPLPVLDPGRGRTKTGYLWAYVRDERPWGSSTASAAWFDYSPNRKGEHPQRQLSGYQGVVQVDAYSGFNAIFECLPSHKYKHKRRATGEKSRITRSLCWAHVRRKLHDVYIALHLPVAREAIHRIDELYAIETEIRGLSAEERLHERQLRSEPLLKDLYTWLLGKLAHLSKKSSLAKAIRYAVKPKHWPALMYYCTDGRVAMDNNAAERSLRTVALGRKSYLFAGSDAGGERAAAMYSLVASCKLNRIDPESYLRYVFERIADHPINRIDELLPWNVALSRPDMVSIEA